MQMVAALTMVSVYSQILMASDVPGISNETKYNICSCLISNISSHAANSFQ